MFCGDPMIHLDNYAISLDRRESNSDADFVSHSHSDHTSAAKSSKNVIASKETAELIKAVNGFQINACSAKIEGMKLLDSGHMLGSKQIRIVNSDSETITYTGDFMLQRSRACNPIEILETDTLIMDSTYCTPEISFDKREEVESAIEKWVPEKQERGIVLFGVSASGKAQEIVKILNGIGITPIVTKKISAVNKVYTANGVKLDYVSAYDNPGDYEHELGDNFVGVVDSHKLDDLAVMFSRSTGKRVYRAVATGWATLFRFNTDVQFPLSDHADFAQSMDYIEAANPKKVLTYGSNSEIFARNLAKEGYNAEPFRNEVGMQYRMLQGSTSLQ